MTRGQQTAVKRYLTEDELEKAIREPKTNNIVHIVQRLCFLKNLYFGDNKTEAAHRVGAS